MAVSTNKDAWERFNQWLNTRTGLVAIRSYQAGDRPALPYLMTHLSNVKRVHDRSRTWYFEETANLNAGGEFEVLAKPEFETEWVYQLHSYSEDDPTEVLEQLRSLIEIPQYQENYFDDFIIHDIEEITNVPEMIENRWEPRAIAMARVRGYKIDTAIVDIVGDDLAHAPFTIETFEP